MYTGSITRHPKNGPKKKEVQTTPSPKKEKPLRITILSMYQKSYKIFFHILYTADLKEKQTDESKLDPIDWELLIFKNDSLLLFPNSQKRQRELAKLTLRKISFCKNHL